MPDPEELLVGTTPIKAGWAIPALHRFYFQSQLASEHLVERNKSLKTQPCTMLSFMFSASLVLRSVSFCYTSADLLERKMFPASCLAYIF